VLDEVHPTKRRTDHSRERVDLAVHRDAVPGADSRKLVD
jgi:hypothetical protein